MYLLPSSQSPMPSSGVPARSTSPSRSEQQKVPEHSRARRDTTDPNLSASTAVVPDDKVLEVFQDKVIQTKSGSDASAYMKGYNTPSSVEIPGYSAKMSDLALMRLALDDSLTPDQLGALQRLSEQRVINDAQAFVSHFAKVMSDKGAKVTPMPQGYYLSMIDRLSKGACSGISHLLSLAMAEGKQHIFLGNIFQAVANPDAPDSQAFFRKIAEVQGYTKFRKIANDPATTTLAPYTEIAPQLLNSPATQTLLINGDVHRVTAGVKVDLNDNRTYYLSDPNNGMVEFSSYKAFEEGLKKYFTAPELQGVLSPAEPGGFFQNPKYVISVFNPTLIPEISPALNGIQFMYDKPLSGLDTVKVIDASRLPTADDFRRQTPAPEVTAQADYERVSKGLEKLHASKGMPQYHQTKSVLESARNFIVDHPGSLLVSAMRELEQRLIGTIREAAAPVDYPYIFESMEFDRIGLAEDKIGPQKKYRTEYVPGAQVQIVTDDNSDPNRSKQVATTLSAALQKLEQRDPDAVKSMGTDFSVVMAKPGTQAETELRLAPPPTLIIGDDFFAPPAASNLTVADRLGRQAQAKGADPMTQKQTALIAGKLGLLAFYNAKPKEFLAMANNNEPFRGGGDQLSARASRSPRDFIAEAFAARLYDGKLESNADASLNKLLSPSGDGLEGKAATQSINVTPPASVARIDSAEVTRLQKLDAGRPLLRIGEIELSRVELYKMGATVDGRSIEDALSGDPDGRALSNKLQVDLERFKDYLKSTSNDVGDRVTNVIAEIGAQRDPASAPLFSAANGSAVPESLQTSMRELSEQSALLKSLQQSKKSLPADAFSPETRGQGGVTKKAGIGFQAFSTFQGLRSSIESFQRGDTKAGAIGVGAVASDYVGLGIQEGLNKVAQKVTTRVSPTILNFTSSSIGKMIGKVGGAAGSAVSVPFDIYNAVDSFKKAANSTGKEAQDHYVNGSIAVTSAVTSLALTAAFLAGASAAGPVGLSVAVVLMVGQQIYSAVRAVEDINEHVPLTGMQKFDTGLRAFLGFEPGFDVMKPYLEAKYGKEHEQDSRVRYKAFLEGPGKVQFERVVFGATEVEAKMVPGKVKLVQPLWYSPITWPLSLIKVDGKVPSVELKGGNDHIADPYKSWNGKEVKTVEGEAGEGKATFWDLGDGDDWATGVKEKPNYFVLGGGKKGINGGDADDTVVINAEARQILEQAEQVATSEKNGFSPRQTSLNGGGGRNTLAFSGTLRTTYKEDGEDKHVRYSGHVINFNTQTVSVKTESSNTEGVKKIAHFQSFSNATTVERGESFIQGNDDNNLLTLNGNNDVVFTGKGVNVIVVNGGANITGEGGSNTYVVNQDYRKVTINDPASSVVKLDYSAAQVSGWEVSPSGDLTVTLTGESLQERRTLVISNAFAHDAKDGDKALPTFVTNDGVMLTVEAPRASSSSVRVPNVNSVKFESGQPKT